MTHTKKSYPLAEFKAILDESGNDTGEFEAYVSVFNNVDFQGDRVLPGAFTKSLDAWSKSGDPIPVSFSHDWSPWSLVGYVDPKNAVQDNKGLRVKGVLDIDTNPTAAQVYSLLKRRIVKEFSFAYDVIEETRAKDGANNLIDLNIIEVGPTLKGANDETELVTVKSALENAHKQLEVLQGKAGRSISEANMEKLQDAHDALSSLGVKCASSDSEKAIRVENAKYFWGAPAGSLEDEQDAVRQAVNAWSNSTYPPAADGSMSYYTCVIATYDDHVVVSVEDYAEGEQKFLAIPYTKADDGTVTLGAPSEVDVELVVTPAKTADADGQKNEEVIDLTVGEEHFETTLEKSEKCTDCEETEEEHFAKAIDNSSWDGPAAMSKCADSDSPASCYNSICAGKRDGDPALASSHALPHHKTAGGPANKSGVANALARLDQTQGLTNEAAARSHLEAHQREYEKAQETALKDYVSYNDLIAELTEHGPASEEVTTATKASEEGTEERNRAKDRSLDDDLAEITDTRLKAEIATFEVVEENENDE